MAKTVLTNARLFMGGVDTTSAANQVELTAEVNAVDVTTYGSGGWNEFIGGLRTATIEAQGFWEAGDPGQVDDATWAQVNDGLSVWSVAPDGAADGALAYTTLMRSSAYRAGGSVGDAAPWSASGNGSSPLARGAIAHPPGVGRTSSGQGTAINLGALPTGKGLYAGVHVMSVSGSASLTVAIESDDAAGFATPTTRATGTAVTTSGAPSSQWLVATLAPGSDSHYRATWAITGSGTCFFVVVLAHG